uniref:Uncharacterized protein n=1 Tax=Meloidogyne enterolobii TaxID=390850 RepID=A0A6V7W9L9_MELEN|nr:unnamed protein product [Meloidogyne enterolobii]
MHQFGLVPEFFHNHPRTPSRDFLLFFKFRMFNLIFNLISDAAIRSLILKSTIRNCTPH